MIYDDPTDIHIRVFLEESSIICIPPEVHIIIMQRL